MSRRLRVSYQGNDNDAKLNCTDIVVSTISGTGTAVKFQAELQGRYLPPDTCPHL